MTPAAPPVILHHGTTLQRARAIEANGPNPNYVEPGGQHVPPAEGFSTHVKDAPIPTEESPAEYARGKARNFPSEGGPGILEVEVPQWIVDLVLIDPLQGGLGRCGEVRFDYGFGLDELLLAWPSLTKKVIPI